MQSGVRDSLLSLIETASGTNKLTDTACARAKGIARKKGLKRAARVEGKKRHVGVSRKLKRQSGAVRWMTTGESLDSGGR